VVGSNWKLGFLFGLVPVVLSQSFNSFDDNHVILYLNLLCLGHLNVLRI
jgi:hypothetical protein